MAVIQSTKYKSKSLNSTYLCTTRQKSQKQMIHVYSWLVMVLSLHLNNVSSLVMNTTTDDTQFKNYNDKTSLMAKIFSRIYFSKQQ